MRNTRKHYKSNRCRILKALPWQLHSLITSFTALTELRDIAFRSRKPHVVSSRILPLSGPTLTRLSSGHLMLEPDGVAVLCEWLFRTLLTRRLTHFEYFADLHFDSSFEDRWRSVIRVTNASLLQELYLGLWVKDFPQGLICSSLGLSFTDRPFIVDPVSQFEILRTLHLYHHSTYKDALFFEASMTSLSQTISSISSKTLEELKIGHSYFAEHFLEAPGGLALSSLNAIDRNLSQIQFSILRKVRLIFMLPTNISMSIDPEVLSYASLVDHKFTVHFFHLWRAERTRSPSTSLIEPKYRSSRTDQHYKELEFEARVREEFKELVARGIFDVVIQNLPPIHQQSPNRDSKRTL